jgi:hypothetical protein
MTRADEPCHAANAEVCASDAITAMRDMDRFCVAAIGGVL